MTSAAVFSLVLQMALAGWSVNPGANDQLWIRWGDGSVLCFPLHPTKYPELPRSARWGTAYDFIQKAQAWSLANGWKNEADPKAKALCNAAFDTDTSLLYPVLPTVSYRVIPATTSRPMYDGAVFLASGAWKQLGTIEIGAACEPEVIRKTTVEYHYATNTAGVRGLAVCQ